MGRYLCPVVESNHHGRYYFVRAESGGRWGNQPRNVTTSRSFVLAASWSAGHRSNNYMDSYFKCRQVVSLSWIVNYHVSPSLILLN